LSYMGIIQNSILLINYEPSVDIKISSPLLREL